MRDGGRGAEYKKWNVQDGIVAGQTVHQPSFGFTYLAIGSLSRGRGRRGGLSHSTHDRNVCVWFLKLIWSLKGTFLC